MKIAIFWSVFLCLLQAGAQTITKGPYLNSVRRDGVAVVWETDSAAAGEVQYGQTNQYGQTASHSGTSQHHEVLLSSLSTGTIYHYRAVSGQATSPGGQFSTAVPPNTPFSFYAYGDTRSNHDQHTEVIQAMLTETGVLFAIHTGDLVSDGAEEEGWQRFFEIESDLLRNTPLFPTVGNHEESDGRVDRFNELFVNPSDTSGHDEYYSFDYGNSHFIVLDYHVNIEGLLVDDLSQEQKDWLLADLDASSSNPLIRNKFVIAHMGPYSSKPGRTGNYALRQLLPTLQTKGVKMVFAGHDHYYERGESDTGLPYCVFGAGGAPLYETDGPGHRSFPPHEVYVSVSVLSYGVITIEGGKITGRAMDTQGNTIDSFTFGEEGPPPPECNVASDCEGREHEDCPGEWECYAWTCDWKCSEPPPECHVDTDCTGEQPPECLEGKWTCSAEKKCIYECSVERECTADVYCEEKDPPENACPGNYRCERGLCVWECAPVDAGTTPDAGAPSSAGDSVGGCECRSGPAAGKGAFAAWLLLLVAFYCVARRKQRVPTARLQARR